MAEEATMLWVDVETTGLDLELDPVLEIGLVITDRWGGVIDEKSSLVWEPGLTWGRGLARGKKNEYVNNMHTESELWYDLKQIDYDNFPSTSFVQTIMLDFLDDNDIKQGELPMCGSSVHFDRERIRKWFPKLEEHFHYRNVDISTLKNLCILLNPDLYEKITERYEETTKQAKHRVLSDIYDSISEYREYYENFLFIGD